MDDDLVKEIETHLAKIPRHLRSRYYYQLLLAAAERIKELEKLLRNRGDKPKKR